MLLDASTRRNLELTETIRKGERKGSLLWVCDQTCTALGVRLLKQWIEKPLLDTAIIDRRLSAVEELGQSPFLADDLRQALKNIYDLERLIGRVCYGNASPRDFIALKNSLAELPKLQQILARLHGPFYEQLFEELDLLEDIYQLIDEAIIADPPLSPKEGGIIKDGFDSQIDEFRKISTAGKSWFMEMEAKEKAETGIKSLKVGFNKVFGYYLEVTKANLSLVPDYYIRKQTTVNGERYITQELKEWEEKILGAKNKLAALEYHLFTEIRQK